jgi:type IV pilus assembly protein PilA
MLQRFRDMRERDEAGFTLIELLVVILIVAILAAIAIPVFLRQREKGWTSQMQSALKNAATDMESAAVPAGGDYLDLDIDALEDEGLRYAADVNLDVASADDEGYCIDATHDSFDDTWFYDSENGEPLEGTCAGPAPAE